MSTQYFIYQTRHTSSSVPSVSFLQPSILSPIFPQQGFPFHKYIEAFSCSQIAYFLIVFFTFFAFFSFHYSGRVIPDTFSILFFKAFEVYFETVLSILFTFATRASLDYSFYVSPALRVFPKRSAFDQQPVVRRKKCENVVLM